MWNANFKNVPTVVCVLCHVPMRGTKGGLVLIKRAQSPRAGLWALPGGYHEHNHHETWQEAGCRELREEIGIVTTPSMMKQYGEVVTDEYENNVIFGYIKLPYHPVFHINEREVRDVTIVTIPNNKYCMRATQAFPLHHRVIHKFFRDGSKGV